MQYTKLSLFLFHSYKESITAFNSVNVTTIESKNAHFNLTDNTLSPFKSK